MEFCLKNLSFVDFAKLQVSLDNPKMAIKVNCILQFVYFDLFWLGRY